VRKLLQHLPYRVLRKFGVASQLYFYRGQIGRLAELPVPHRVVVDRWDLTKLSHYLGECDQLNQTHQEYLRNGQADCIGAEIDGGLAGFTWVTRGEVPGEMNHCGHPATHLPLSLPDDAAYLFHAYVRPGDRGKGLYPGLIGETARQLDATGVKRLFLTTECTNTAALASVARMGFARIGESKLWKLGPLLRVHYPDLASQHGIRLGRYAGDTRHRD
jgi:ribosomal protein S18 acetylase RimI-like enzyme